MADRYQLIIRGARVLDPSQGIDATTDILVRDGKIAGIRAAEPDATAERLLDARGLIASPGWIDLHAHVFHGMGPMGGTGVHPDRDAGVGVGVTTVVDAGSSGAATWSAFRDYVARPAVSRVLAFLNVSLLPSTQPRHGDWTAFNQKLTIQTAEANPDTIVGIKVLASQTHCGNMGIEPVKLARQAARLSGTRLMVHIGNAPPVIEDVLALLDEGDIVTHCWHGKPGGLLDRNGKPIPAARAAADRGVLFDIGHGQASFSFATARLCMEAGMPLHSISTDIHRANLKGPVFDMATTMAKFLHLGMSLPEVIRLSTLGPARCLGLEHEVGTLRTGVDADVTIFRLKEAPITLTDSERHSEQGRVTLEPIWTVRAGRVVREPDGVPKQ